MVWWNRSLHMPTKYKNDRHDRKLEHLNIAEKAMQTWIDEKSIIDSNKHKTQN